MKKLNTLIIALIYCFCSTAQQATLSNVVIINIPKKALKINKEQAVAYSKKNFKKSEISSLNTKNLYKIDQVIFGFWDSKVGLEGRRTLEDIKAEALELYKLSSSITVHDASIKKINNVGLLVINYKNGDANYYRFISEYRNHQSMSGIVQYELSDRRNATKILDEVLKSITFK